MLGVITTTQLDAATKYTILLDRRESILDGIRERSSLIHTYILT